MANLIDEQQLGTLGVRRIAIDTDPEELVLPAETEKRLGWIAGWLSQPPFIFREWGLSRYVDGGLRALFRGDSGTGKTMAAVALAKSSGLELYRVDLSHVFSNYTGDTEKNLDRTFKAAEEAGAILMFDEADALMGKRTQVHDAHDRYANVEVAYLLQRLETFPGLAILASNLRGNLDQAILGRIDVLVDFPKPDAKAREAIWGKLLNAVKLDKADKIDLARLARHELSGAEILRAVRMASLLAAGEEMPLDMAHLEAAALERVEMRS